MPPSITFEQYAYYDQDVATNLQINDQSIVQNIKDENSSESEDDEVVRPSITRTQAMKKIDDLKYYLQCQPNTSETFRKIRKQFENSINSFSVEKQTLINDFSLIFDDQLINLFSISNISYFSFKYQFFYINKILINYKVFLLAPP